MNYICVYTLIGKSMAMKYKEVLKCSTFFIHVQNDALDLIIKTELNHIYSLCWPYQNFLVLYKSHTIYIILYVVLTHNVVFKYENME